MIETDIWRNLLYTIYYLREVGIKMPKFLFHMSMHVIFKIDQQGYKNSINGMKYRGEN